MRKLAAALAALIMSLLVLVAIPTSPAEAGSCTISNPEMNSTWGCAKASYHTSSSRYVTAQDRNTGDGHPLRIRYQINGGQSWFWHSTRFNSSTPTTRVVSVYYLNYISGFQVCRGYQSWTCQNI